MKELTNKEMIVEIEKDIKLMRASIRIDFASIAITQKHMRIAHLAIEYHRKNEKIESLLYFCLNGKYPDA